MKIAYIISAYKLPEQLVRLVGKLNTDSISFYIHIDKRTDYAIYRRMTDPLSNLSNVHFLERHLCIWGDFGHVRATLKGIREILNCGVDCDYVILLTGQDYPIKSNNYIQEFFQENMGRSFINYNTLPHADWTGNGGLDRIDRWHFIWSGRHFAFPPVHRFRIHILNHLLKLSRDIFPIRRKLPGHFKPFGGSSYWCLSRDCVEYINKFVQNNSKFIKFFENVRIPDEIFFQTILLNSALKETLVNTDLRYIDWSKPTPPFPSILGKQDFDQFINTDKLFARKFDITVDADVLDLIDEVTS